MKNIMQDPNAVTSEADVTTTSQSPFLKAVTGTHVYLFHCVNSKQPL
jgi:hypothetical protein